MSAFDTCLPPLLHREGGFVNHPRDPGGMTNLGATRRAWEAWLHRPVSEAEMRALTPAVVAPFYRARYWNALSCDALPPALASCVFDFGVNSGVDRAARYLQRLVSATEDGHIGPNTLSAVSSFVARRGAAEAVRQYQQSRIAFYRKLPTFDVFGKGWLNRVAEVETAALRMLP